MKVTAMLCNHAEVQNNMLYISGAGVTRSIAPPGSQPPWGVNLALGIMVMVPWTKTNEQHTLAVILADADGHPVHLPAGPDTTQDARVDMAFNVGRPPELAVGDDQTVCLAVNFPNLPLTNLGRYRFSIEVDGSVEDTLAYQLVSPQGITITGSSPTALPRL